jgi:hypothetical protein
VSNFQEIHEGTDPPTATVPNSYSHASVILAGTLRGIIESMTDRKKVY